MLSHMGSSGRPFSSVHTQSSWFLSLSRKHEEFEVETDQAGEWPVPFWSETVRQVVVE